MKKITTPKWIWTFIIWHAGSNQVNYMNVSQTYQSKKTTKEKEEDKKKKKIADKKRGGKKSVNR